MPLAVAAGAFAPLRHPAFRALWLASLASNIGLWIQNTGAGWLAAAPTACPEHHPGGIAPDILRSALAERARELCFRGFAVLHSGVARTALAAAERLTRERVQAARGLERENAFHEEGRAARAADRREEPVRLKHALGLVPAKALAAGPSGWLLASTPGRAPAGATG